MKTNALAITAAFYLCFNFVTIDGYLIEGDRVKFILPGHQPGKNVFVSGNFNGWAKQDPNWKMDFDESSGSYVLVKPFTGIRQKGRTFYEFTFRINDQLIDANPQGKNVIHCAGYGYRYVIKFPDQY